MMEQISIFDLLTEPVESHFTAQIRRGSGFEPKELNLCVDCANEVEFCIEKIRGDKKHGCI